MLWRFTLLSHALVLLIACSTSLLIPDRRSARRHVRLVRPRASQRGGGGGADNDADREDDVMQKFQQAWVGFEKKEGTMTSNGHDKEKPVPVQKTSEPMTDSARSNGEKSVRPIPGAANQAVVSTWDTRKESPFFDKKKRERSAAFVDGKKESVSSALENKSTPEDTKTGGKGLSVFMEDVRAEIAADEEEEDTRPKLELLQRLENAKCIFLGIGVGILAVIPFTAFHHFVYQPQYTSITQWEFDTYTAAIQGALFCLTYRYALRRAEELPVAIPSTVISSFVGVRTLSRIHVPMRCTPLPLHCGEILGFASWSMAGELVVNYAESMALFGAVGMAMDMALERRWIRLYRSSDAKSE